MQPRALRALLTVNVALFVLWLLIFGNIEATRTFFLDHLALQADPATVLWQPWQFITYNFLHLSGGLGGLPHIGFNMLWMFWLGKELEEMQGSAKVFALYIIAGIGGDLLSVIMYGFVGGLMASGAAAHTIIFGASASVLGIMTATAVYYPQKQIGLLFIGVVPLRYVVIGFLVLDFLLMSGRSTAVWAHVGGALFGFLFVRADQAGIDLFSWAGLFFPSRGGYGRGGDEGMLQRLENWLASRKGSTKQDPPPKRRTSTLRKVDTDVDVAEEPSRQSEVDRILDKIRAEGYETLTPEEKRILYDASRD